MSSASVPNQNSKTPLDAAQKIVAELSGMQKDDQVLAIKFAVETLRLEFPTAVASAASLVPASSAPAPSAPAPLPLIPGNSMDIRSFTDTKSPKSDQQFAAVVAYYYQFQAPAGQRRETIDAMLMKEAARQAGRKQVSDWLVTLNNAVRTGYLDRADRGSFKLNSVGENLVAISLPNGNAAGQGNGGGLRVVVAKKKKATGRLSKKTSR